jgi:hypothetical protein
MGVISASEKRLIVAFWMMSELRSCGKGWPGKWQGVRIRVLFYNQCLVIIFLSRVRLKNFKQGLIDLLAGFEQGFVG